MRAWPVVLACLLFPVSAFGGDEETPMGSDYTGPKAVVGVGRFTVEVKGAPNEIGDGLREMLMTALFESNRFIVVDRMDMGGLSGEQLLSDSFLADPDAILSQKKMDPAEVMVSGAVTALEGSGGGVYFKIPGAPVASGGTVHQARVVVELRFIDTASGRVIAAKAVEGTADSFKVSAGSGSADLPLGLETFRNTPLELAVRDCIHRALIKLCKTIPSSYYTHRE
jgi:curli biogenesis system outer membrane secretion channel CsgG